MESSIAVNLETLRARLEQLVNLMVLLSLSWQQLLWISL